MSAPTIETTLPRPGARAVPRPLAALDGASPLAHVPPQWFTTVMGTGIVANAAVGLPIALPGLPAAARVLWALTAAWLVVVLAATLAHHRRHPARARTHLAHPVTGHAYGAAAMALMTVGLGALLHGAPLLGARPTVVLAAGLWSAGTVLGLATAVALPLRLFLRTDVRASEPGGVWLMPVVAPMVSAATGPALAAHVRDPDLRASLLLLCGALFGAALLAAALTLTTVWSRLVHHGVGDGAAVLGLWIVLGPLGQAATAAHALAGGVGALAPRLGTTADVLALAVGVPLLGFALLWLAVVVVLTARTRPSFGLGWWALTFPVGTCVTGLSGVAAVVHLPVVDAAAVGLFVVLAGTWAVVAARTAAGLWSGALLRG